MESRTITAKEADELLGKWASESRQVCFAVSLGSQGWHIPWFGPVRSAEPGRWIQTAEQTTNMVCTDLYDQIVLMEDEDLTAIQFKSPKGFTAANFEVNLFIVKRGDITKQSEALLKKMFR
jgi:hypothetical protein